MLYLESPSLDPYFNLALEEYLFTVLPPHEQCLLLWQNKNAIVLGNYQNAIEEINPTYVKEHAIKVARRLSGGGAVYHDLGNLNYTLIIDQDKLEDFSFHILVRPVIQTLASFGIQAECTGRNDLTIHGKKFSGSSQFTQNGRLLHHGCIMLDSDLNAVATALKVRAAKFISKSVKSVASRVTTINDNVAFPIPMHLFKTTLTHHFLRNTPSQSYKLTMTDLSNVRKLRDEKYATWMWNYGRCADYSIQKEHKFPAGLVNISMEVENVQIKNIRIFGDFFGKGDIHELEQSMIGLILDQTLTSNLQKASVSHYMNGITPADLSSLLLH